MALLQGMSTAGRASSGVRAGIIDLGTNTFKLLIFTHHAGQLNVLHREELPVFLGRGGIEQGRIGAEAWERGMAALQRLVALAHSHGAQHIAGFGTSALRSAGNGEAFTAQALQELGLSITIIPGDREAELIIAGVRQAVPLGNDPALVMDIGGGSTEFILATERSLLWKRSFELGVTRLRERFPCTGPMPQADEERIGAHLDENLGPLYAELERHRPQLLVGSAGSFDTLAAMIAADRGTTIDAEARSLRFAKDIFLALKDRLLRMDPAQRQAVPGLPAHRVETIPYALVQIERVLAASGIRELAWSRYALKEGAAAQLLAKEG